MLIAIKDKRRFRGAQRLAAGLLLLGLGGACLPPSSAAAEREIAAGGRSSCAILSPAQASCWGADEFGQLADGLDQNSSAPVPVAIGGAEVAGVAVGAADACFRLVAGTIRCAGANRAGQLGDGETGGPSSLPREVLGVAEAVDVSVGQETACAVSAQGHVYCWGAAGYGLLGSGAGHVLSDEPVEIPGVEGATQVSVGASSACALVVGGQVECWGRSNEGQLGGGSVLYETCEPDRGIYCSRVPVVTGVTGASEISVGADHACALLASGSVECWGANAVAQLGEGTNIGPESCSAGTFGESVACSAVPRTVPALSGAIGIEAGESDSCALMADGTVRCWGQDSHGELGTGAESACYELGRDEPPYRPAACTLTPTLVPEAAGVREIATGGSHLCALEAQGEYRCWGRNTSGELGDGSTVSEPVVLTGPRPHAAATTATIEGVVNPGGRVIAACTFEYGPGASFDQSVPCATPPGTGGEPEAVSANLTGLLPGTVYSYRLVVATGSKLVQGGAETFATEPLPVLPFLGRCEPSAPGLGEFGAAGCTTSQTEGSFEWAPWPLARPHFTAKIKKLILETPSRDSIKCAAGTLAGEYTGPRGAAAALTLTGCVASHIATGACRTSGAAAGEVRSSPLVGTLGAVAETPTPTLGWELAPAGTEPIATLECGATSIALFGAAVGIVTPLDAMSAKYKLTFAAKHGLQSPEGFLSTGRLTLGLRTSDGEQAAGLKAKLSLVGEEPIELKALA
jgi:alpha-tubulin suppressor-like RCC1 family protein